MYLTLDDGQNLPKLVACVDEANKNCCGSEMCFSFFLTNLQSSTQGCRSRK